ncbi:MAG: class I SAM-dependent methyltransferase [Litoreibacter sp.]
MSIQDQYEAYPYPERDPRDEKSRLVVGSPSHPLEIDHILFGGRRDWSAGTRILVAGGGTGDALVQLAQIMTSAGRPYEITYLDLSKASRKIAEARIKARGLKGVTFHTGSLLDAADYGPFDYIDCCGVLHHLPEPQQGFDALAQALAPKGGIGLMVYAPYGRSGVYPLQEAFRALSVDMTTSERLTLAKSIYKTLPDGHPFKRNPHLVDHEASDAGFYDLLLHSQDQPFHFDRLIEMIEASGLTFSGVPQSALYELERFMPDQQNDLSDIGRMALAEKLDGTLKTHIVYASRDAAPKFDGTSVPHLKGLNSKALAHKVAADGKIDVTLNGTKHMVTLPKGSAPILARINGRKSLDELRFACRLDALAWNTLWQPTQRELSRFGLLLFSRLLT